MWVTRIVKLPYVDVLWLKRSRWNQMHWCSSKWLWWVMVLRRRLTWQVLYLLWMLKSWSAPQTLTFPPCWKVRSPVYRLLLTDSLVPIHLLESVVSVHSVAQLLFMWLMVCPWVQPSVTSHQTTLRPSRCWRMLLLVPSTVLELLMVW